MAASMVGTGSSSSLARDALGVGLRPAHYKHIFEHWPSLDYFEIISDNFITEALPPRRNLARIRGHYPVVLHGVGLNLLGHEALDERYLEAVARLADEVDAPFVTDHLCWTGAQGFTTPRSSARALHRGLGRLRCRARALRARAHRAAVRAREPLDLRRATRFDDERACVLHARREGSRLLLHARHQQRLRVEREPRLRSARVHRRRGFRSRFAGAPRWAYAARERHDHRHPRSPDLRCVWRLYGDAYRKAGRSRR